MSCTVVILQPGYLPWLGFFDQMARADTFVYYDDVQFDKGGWRNRNRIKTAQGVQWLTVPVRQKARARQTISEVEIDNRGDWARKQLASIRQAYAKAPHLARYMAEIEELLSPTWSKLADLDIAVASAMARWIGITTPIYRSSTLGIEGDKNSRLLAICRHFCADCYLSGQAAKSYLDVALFERCGVEIAWQDYHHPTYPQLHGDFVSHLSALDLILNMGPDSRRVLLEQNQGK